MTQAADADETEGAENTFAARFCGTGNIGQPVEDKLAQGVR